MILAIFVVTGLWGGALAFNRALRPTDKPPGELDHVAWFYALLIIMTAVLATRSWLHAPALEWVLLSLLLGGNFYFCRRIFHRLKAWPSIKSSSSWLAGFLMLALILDGLYASLPLYRYDQWTYHLVVAKWISQMGTLTPPITNDHIFFTGNYEFLGLLARSISSVDTFQQGFQNSLSWLLVVTPAAAAFYVGLEQKIWSLIASLGFALICLFGTGDHEALINAKPDYLLMMMALILLIFATGGPRKLSPWLAGFLLVGGLSFKITWLHFAACGPIIVLAALGKNWLRGGLQIISGGLAGTTCLLPWAFKNWHYFRNPLHPAQSPLFSSSIWSPMYETYWQSVSKKPIGIEAFLRNLWDVFLGLPARWGVSGIVCLIFLFMLWRHRQLPRSLDRGHLGIIGCLACYVGVWGVFYGAGIFNRFVAPAFAFPLIFIWLASRQMLFSWLSVLALLIPLATNGQLEVTLSRLAAASQKSWLEFSQSQGDGPLDKIPDLLAIADDRKLMFPDAPYTGSSLLSDFAFNYYAPSIFWIAEDPITWWQMTHAGIDPHMGDGMNFLRKMDIRYVWIVDENKFRQAPPAIQNVIPRLERLPSRLGKLYFVNFSEAEQRR
jgi:hypothetical protein